MSPHNTYKPAKSNYDAVLHWYFDCWQDNLHGLVMHILVDLKWLWMQLLMKRLYGYIWIKVALWSEFSRY